MKTTLQKIPPSRQACLTRRIARRATRVRIPLAKARIRLLRQSFALIEPQADIAGLAFYRNLFTVDPALRSLFHTGIERQAGKLMKALSYTIETLENPEALVPVLHALGRRHLSYNVRDEHYRTVVEALLQTLAQTLGAHFSTEVRDAWRDALGFISQTMKCGASSTAALKSKDWSPSA